MDVRAAPKPCCFAALLPSIAVGSHTLSPHGLAACNLCDSDVLTVTKLFYTAGLPDPTRSKGLTVQNDYKNIHIGVMASINGKYAPIYVSKEPELKNTVVELEPKNNIKIFFHNKYETNSMISSAVSNAVSLDFTTTSSQQVRYSNGSWYPVSTLALKQKSFHP